MMLYHNTDLEALEKIVDSGIIRATHYSSFDDKDELRLGIDLVLEEVRRYPVEKRDIPYRNFLTQGIEGFREGELNVYVLSLTENQNSPYHWKNYGDVAIGFSEMIHEGFLVSMKHRFPGTCENELRHNPAHWTTCYYEGTFDLTAFVAERFFNPKNYPTMFRRARQTDLWLTPLLAVSVYQAICSIKQPKFKSEVEKRYMRINPNEREYPAKVEGNKRFIEMQFDPRAYIQEIWAGPACNRAACEALVARWNREGKLNCCVMYGS